MHEIVDFLAWKVFSPIVLAVLTLTLAHVHLWKHRNRDRIIQSSRYSYLVRSFNWLVFSIAFFVFPLVPVVDGRAMLRLALAFLVLSELAGRWPYIKEIIPSHKNG